MSPKLTLLTAKSGRFALIPIALFADLFATGAFTISQNVATAVGVLLSTVGLVVVVIKWIEGKIAAQIREHNKEVVAKLALQDVTAKASQDLLIQQLVAQNQAADASKRELLLRLQHLNDLMASIPHNLKRRE